MKKIFTIYNLVPESDANGIEVSTTEELYNIIRKYWNVGPSQIQFDYNEYAKLYDVRLTSKTGETFALIGDINFNPYK
jgi:hypothetical protein